jgi:hypothetical protein
MSQFNYPGVNPEKRRYFVGSDINNEYLDYKDKAVVAGKDSKAYTDEANLRKAKKPYNGVAKKAGNHLYYEEGHKILQPKAEKVAASAGE